MKKILSVITKEELDEIIDKKKINSELYNAYFRFKENQPTWFKLMNFFDLDEIHRSGKKLDLHLFMKRADYFSLLFKFSYIIKRIFKRICLIKLIYSYKKNLKKIHL